MITVELPDLEPYQKDIIEAYIETTKGKWFVVKSPRQVGKSILLECLLVAASVHSDRSHSVSISPISALARKLFNDISVMAALIIKKSNASLLEIKFINDSTINFYSAESGDNLRGDTVKRDGILCIDEAAYIKEDFFYDVAVPFTNVYLSDIFLFSTPKFKQGLFYDLYAKGIADEDDVKSFDWTTYDLSKYLPEKTLERYRSRLPKNAFRSEYLAEFIEGDGAVFSDFKKCVNNYKIDPNLEVWLSCDWGTGLGLDDTVITVGQYNKTINKIGISELISFNNLGTSDTVGLILHKIKDLVKLGCKEITVIAEKNSIGNVFFSVMKEAVDEFVEKYNDDEGWRNEINVRLALFTTTNKSKDSIIKELILLFELENIVLPNDEKLLNQLAMYECTVSSKGNLIYNAPSGFHDDCVMSLAIMISLLYNKILH